MASAGAGNLAEQEEGGGGFPAASLPAQGWARNDIHNPCAHHAAPLRLRPRRDSGSAASEHPFFWSCPWTGVLGASFEEQGHSTSKFLGKESELQGPQILFPGESLAWGCPLALRGLSSSAGARLVRSILQPSQTREFSESAPNFKSKELIAS